ncbi:hypothetical protein ACFOWX_10830 [Sphingorhabdus arenilitoris]|uniref:Uncharacterized protein n=1 Tax=Sphingorhabdus arenilitoris TaxID=1490041 RepID=A0ABV8RHI8_9SPHN
MLLSKIFPAADNCLYDVPKNDACLILSVRSWFVMRHAGEDPLPHISRYLGSSIIAMRFGVMMEVVQQIWPDRFAICRPCCRGVSIDEMLLIRLIRAAREGAAPVFDQLCAEMIGRDGRHLLYHHDVRLCVDE